MANLMFIGVPYWLGKKDEYTGSVEIVRESGLAGELGAAWIDIQPDFAAYDDPVVAVNRAIAETIAAHPDHLPVVIAGDCTSSLGVMKGLERHQPNLLWLDAHGDFNTPETTPSGFLGGMPLAAMVGLGNQHLLDGIDLKPIDDRTITITDARDLDPGETELVRNSRMTHLTDVSDTLKQDWQQKPLYIHFDADVLNLDDMPAVAYPAANGPTFDATINAARHAMQSGRLVGMSLTLWSNNLPGAETSKATVERAIRALFGG